MEADESQRERWEDLLRREKYECLVCCEHVRIRDFIWNCFNCHTIFHLNCIKTWALAGGSVGKPEQNQGWRCPVCQFVRIRIPNRYYCFCGKIREPDLNRYLVPHSCGNTCGKRRRTQRSGNNCNHQCNLQCHPGPCPPCHMKVFKFCCCGKSSFSVKCDDAKKELVCDKACLRPLNCGKHRCQRSCHGGECSPCGVFVRQSCYCGQNSRSVSCTSESSKIVYYSCEKICSRKLNCQNHHCTEVCHADACKPCPRSPESVLNCPCGKKSIEELSAKRRKKCTDPVPVCNQICNKSLACGPEAEPHRCKQLCHEGPCPPCPSKTVVRCNCGANSESVSCKQYKAETFLCKRRCNKKLTCGRHKCLTECCTQKDHTCSQICGKKLSCNLHTCQEVCHRSPCPPCWNVSWDDLTCLCGSSRISPPVACGTKLPECTQPCTRTHSCNHPVYHNCHSDNSCPPCTELVDRICYGGHELCRNVPCYNEGVSCGKTCLKPLPCGIHSCQKVCHFGDCGKCTLPCPFIRERCGHVCSLPCHQLTSKTCPDVPCKVMMQLHCTCGRRKSMEPCHKVSSQEMRIPVTLLASIKNQSEETINVSDLLNKAKEDKLCRLECDEMCAVIERNRRLAEALNIAEADLSPNPGPPNYAEILKHAARENPEFVKFVYDALVNLVKEAKQSTQGFKHLNFPPMRSDQREIIHLLVEHFGCKSHAVDREPHRSVIVKANKSKCFLPTCSVLDMVKEEQASKGSRYAIEKPVEKKDTGEILKRSANAVKHNGAELSGDKPIDYFDIIKD